VLQHPRITKIHDVISRTDAVYIVLELYGGGDLLDGQLRHWETKGKIPMATVQHLSQQMWEALAFLHSKSYAHRDVKGDNFMMSLPELEHPANRIYLGDFGNAVQLEPGSRLSQTCGTRQYWAPEMYRRNYADKVDCWAIGVIMCGLVSGTFPFRSEEDVKHKEIQIPCRVCEEGQQLIKWALQRDETKRCTAAQAEGHPFNSGRKQEVVGGNLHSATRRGNVREL